MRSAGHTGRKKHILRGLTRKFCKTMLGPEPYSVQIPCQDITAPRGAMLYTDMPIFLPSQWLSVLTNNASLEFELDTIFGTSKLQEFGATQTQACPTPRQTRETDRTKRNTEPIESNCPMHGRCMANTWPMHGHFFAKS